MRSLVLALAAGLAACGTEPDTQRVDAQVNWAEWPAEVLASTPFTVRLVGYGVTCADVKDFNADPAVDNSAVTFTPYYIVAAPMQPCPFEGNRQTLPGPPATTLDVPIAPFFDTRAAVPGLAVQYPRTYEIRAGTDVSVPSPLAESAYPIRTFGEVIVRTDVADPAAILAAGLAQITRDSLGCARLYVSGIGQAYDVDNPPDTATYWYGFVRGSIRAVPLSACGERVAMHIDSSVRRY